MQTPHMYYVLILFRQEDYSRAFATVGLRFEIPRWRALCFRAAGIAAW